MLVILFVITQGISTAEYRTITKEETISIGADPRGNPARSINLAEKHNTSWNGSWETFTGETIGGHWIGALIPESLARHNLTGTSVSVGTLLSITAQDIGTGASEMWFRSPIAYQEGMGLRLQIWAISGSAVINVSEVTDDGPSLLTVCNPRLVWNWSYSMTYERTTNVTDNRTFLRVTAPLYPDQRYFVSFTATSLASYADIYWTQCDLWNDKRYWSYVWNGSDVTWIPLDLGVSMLITRTAGAGITGMTLEEPAGSFFAMSWDVTLNGTVQNNSYLTFTMPFQTEGDNSTDIWVYIVGWNDTDPLWSFYKTAENASNFVIFSGQVIYNDSQTYDRIEIQIAFDGNESTIWLRDPNSRLIDDAPVTTVTTPASEEWSFTPVFSLQITDGILGLYERPWIKFGTIRIGPVHTIFQHASQFEFIMMDDALVLAISLGVQWVVDQVTAGAQSLYDWLSSALIWLYDSLVDFLGSAGVWLWDHIGVYVYAVVSVIVNAFVDATVTLINILLVVIPLLIFAALVNFWAKFLRSFRVWYTEGYDAYAMYLEREMIHIFSVASKGVRVAMNPKSIVKVARGRIRREYATLTGAGMARSERATIQRARKTTRRIYKKISTSSGKAGRKSAARSRTSRKTVKPKEPTSAEKRFDRSFGASEESGKSKEKAGSTFGDYKLDESGSEKPKESEKEKAGPTFGDYKFDESGRAVKSKS